MDAPDRDAAKALALTPAEVEALGDDADSVFWFRRYHRQGSEFKFDSNVSRLWVLNEDGRYDGSLYNRNAPFDDYVPFDFSTVVERVVTTRGAWMRRARRFEPSVTRVLEGHGHGGWVELGHRRDLELHQLGVGAAGQRIRE